MGEKNILTLDDEFIQYCELNNIKGPDIIKLAEKCFNRGFTIEKYGESPPNLVVKKEEAEQPSKTTQPTSKRDKLYGE